MKKLLSVLAFLLVGSTAFAQLIPVTFGPKVGINYSTLIKDNVDLSSTYRLGFVAGGFVRVNIKKLYIQPEVYFTSRNSDVTIGGTSFKSQIQSVDIPVMLGYKVVDLKLVNVRLMLGPVASVTTSTGGDLVADNINSFSWGGQAGVGVDIAKITVDLRYEWTFDRFKESAGAGKPSNGLFQLGVGFKIL